MANNSLPNIPNFIDLNNIRINSKSIAPHLQKKINTYLLPETKNAEYFQGTSTGLSRCSIGITPITDDKLKKLKYTVIRLYATQMLNILKTSGLNKSQTYKIMQLKTILNSVILNEIEYEFSIRIGKFITFLHDICENDEHINNIVIDYDNVNMYL